MALFDTIWASDDEALIDTPTAAEIEAGFSCGKASPGRFNWLFQVLMSTINSLNLGDMASKFRAINTADGISGGGDLTEDRTLRLDIAGMEESTSIASDDLVAIHDSSANAPRMMTRANFVAGLGGGAGSVAGASNAGDGAGEFVAGLDGDSIQIRNLFNAGGIAIAVSGNNVTVALADMGSALTIE